MVCPCVRMLLFVACVFYRPCMGMIVFCFQFKLIMDGHWGHSKDHPITKDAENNVNNTIEVRGEGLGGTCLKLGIFERAWGRWMVCVALAVGLLLTGLAGSRPI